MYIFLKKMDAANRLKEVLNESGLNQTGFAESIGSTQATLSRQLNGKHKIDRQVALSIKAVYDINPEWLLYGNGTKKGGNGYSIINSSINNSFNNTHQYYLDADEKKLIDKIRRKSQSREVIQALLKFMLIVVAISVFTLF